jgi:hypothetical protein
LTELVSFISVCVSFCCICFLCYLLFKKTKQVQKLEKKIQADLPENLEFATTEQLFGEMRKRQSIPYVLLMPINKEDHSGLTIEIHNMPPAMSLSMMKMATVVTAKEMKQRGVDLSEVEFPPEFPTDLFNADDN